MKRVGPIWKYTKEEREWALQHGWSERDLNLQEKIINNSFY